MEDDEVALLELVGLDVVEGLADVEFVALELLPVEAGVDVDDF